MQRLHANAKLTPALRRLLVQRVRDLGWRVTEAAAAAGVAALVACIVIGPRRGYGQTVMPPHNMTMCVTRTGMLWIGWYGFNGGSALAANGDAATAVTVTQISASTAAFTWMCIDWATLGKPTVLGLATGAIAGLAAVTPARAASDRSEGWPSGSPPAPSAGTPR